MILLALSFGDFSMMIGDWFSWYFNGIDRCGLGPERWGEDCSNSYSNR